MIDLGTLGGSLSEGFGIDNAGHVVGTSNLPNDQGRHAFIYISGIGMIDLNDLIARDSGWELQVARAINDRGEIVGFGLINGKSRAFLLEPVHRK
jgi:probable HAF family extracellular repeat protein